MKAPKELPLALVCDKLVKKQKPWPNLHWLGEDDKKVFQISRHQIGEVNLVSGAASKVSSLSTVTRNATAVNLTPDGKYVCGLLSSGDLFIWDHGKKTLVQAQGIPEVVTRIPDSGRKTSGEPLQAVLDFFTQWSPQATDTSDPPGGQEDGCSLPPHHRPYIFASPHCSKVIVVIGASQVYVWEKDMDGDREETTGVLAGTWSVAACPSHVCLPNIQSKETQVACCFTNESVGEECHISFVFMDTTCIMVTTLNVSWCHSASSPHIPPPHTDDAPQTPSSHSSYTHSSRWHSISVSLSYAGLQTEELLHKKGTFIARYAHNQGILCVAVNSKCQHPKLVYVHPLCTTAVVTDVASTHGQQKYLNTNQIKPHIVSDLAWSHSNTFIVGCVKSGALFVATRLGPLLRLSCSGENLILHPAMLLPLQPHAESPRNEEGSESTESGSSSRIRFRVSCHPTKDKFLLSSGFRVSVLTFPSSAASDADIADHLLKSAHHSLHFLRHSSLTHDYAYIHTSTWRLAQSTLDLASTSKPSGCQVSLWTNCEPGSADWKVKHPATPCELDLLIEQTLNPLLATWSLIVSYKGPQTQDWQRRTRATVRLLVKLLHTLMLTSVDDDTIEHQACLVQILHIFHRFVGVLAVWPKSIHLVKPTLHLTHKLIHAILSCESHAGERRSISTILILTQTLTTIEQILVSAMTFRPKIKSSTLCEYDPELLYPGIEVTNIPSVSWASGKGECDNPVVSNRMTKLWLCLYTHASKIHSRITGKKLERSAYQKSVAALNIIQGKLQKFRYDFSPQKIKIQYSPVKCLKGLYLSAIDGWKAQILVGLSEETKTKKLSQYLHSILYAYMLREDMAGLSEYLLWLYDIVKLVLFTKNQPMSSSFLTSTPKTKAGEAIASQDLEFDGLRKQRKKDNKKEEASARMLKKKKLKEAKNGTPSEEMVVNRSRKISKALKKDEFQGKSFKPAIFNSDGTSPSLDLSTVGSKVRWRVIKAARRVIGSFGRKAASDVLGLTSEVPPPHKPHLFPSLQKADSQEEDEVSEEVSQSPHRHKANPYILPWNARLAGQALAVAGEWADLTALAQSTGDIGTSLIASVLGTMVGSDSIPAQSLLPSSLITKQLLDTGPHLSFNTATLYHHQDLLQAAAMCSAVVLPQVLSHCVDLIDSIIRQLDVFVPLSIYLPAPPVYCPQMMKHPDPLPLSHGGSVSCEDELRVETAGWVQLACSVISAAGVAQPLLLDLLHTDTIVGHRQVPRTFHAELHKMAEAVGGSREAPRPEGEEWSQVTEIWRRFLTKLWILHARDRLSRCLRKFAVSDHSSRRRKATKESSALEILQWIEELHTFTDCDDWKHELVATALTVAADCPSCPSIARILGRLIPDPCKLPSLSKDKANRLFDVWKSIDIPVSELKMPPLVSDMKILSHTKGNDDNSTSLHESSGKRNDDNVSSPPETFVKLYAVYEEMCREVEHQIRSLESTKQSEITSRNIQESSSGQNRLHEVLQEDFWKFLYLFISMTFVRNIEACPQLATSTPLLAQFSDVIKDREFLGIKVKSQIMQSYDQDSGDHLSGVSDDDVLLELIGARRDSVEHKGFFQNLGHSLNRGAALSNTHIICNENGCRKHHKSLISSSVRKNLSDKTRSISSSPSPRRRWHIPRRSGKTDNRSRSLSVRRKQSVSTSQDECIRRPSLELLSQLFMPQNPDLSLAFSRLLQLPDYCKCNVEFLPGVFELVKWMMSSERKFSLLDLMPDGPSSTDKTTKVHINLSVEDIIQSLKWESMSQDGYASSPVNAYVEKKRTGHIASRRNKEHISQKHRSEKCGRQDTVLGGDDADYVEQDPNILIHSCVIDSATSLPKDTAPVTIAAVKNKDLVRTLDEEEKPVHSHPRKSKSRKGKHLSFDYAKATVTAMEGTHIKKKQGPRIATEESTRHPMGDVRGSETDGKPYEYEVHSKSSFMHVHPSIKQMTEVRSFNSQGDTTSGPERNLKVESVQDFGDNASASAVNGDVLKESSSTVTSGSPGCSQRMVSTETDKGIRLDQSPRSRVSQTGDSIHQSISRIDTDLPDGQYKEGSNVESESHEGRNGKASGGLKSTKSGEQVTNIPPSGFTSLPVNSKENEENIHKSESRSVSENRDKMQSEKDSDANRSWEPFKAVHEKSPKPHNFNIKVEEAEKHLPTLRISPSFCETRHGLTSVEVPEENENLNVVRVGRLLHMPKEKITVDENKHLNLSELTGESDKSQNESISVDVNNTLDDLTLPDSLHASDLSKGSELSLTSHAIRDHIILKSKLHVPQNLNQTKQERLRMKDEAWNSVKTVGDKRNLGNTVTVRSATNKIQPRKWDDRELRLKPIPLKIKPSFKNAGRFENDWISGEILKENKREGRNIRLLKTDQPQIPDNASTVKQQKPLQLKPVPVFLLNRRNLGNVGFKAHGQEHSKILINGGDNKNMRILNLPPQLHSQIRKGKNSKPLSLLDPQQVFSFYVANMVKNDKFKVLKIKEKLEERLSKGKVQASMENEKKREKEHVGKKAVEKDAKIENIDQGFLDKVEEYAQRFKTGRYREMLSGRSNENKEETLASIQYKATRMRDEVDKNRYEGMPSENCFEYKGENQLRNQYEAMRFKDEIEGNRRTDILSGEGSEEEEAAQSAIQYKATRVMDKIAENLHRDTTEEGNVTPLRENLSHQNLIRENKKMVSVSVQVNEKQSHHLALRKSCSPPGSGVDEDGAAITAATTMVRKRNLLVRDSWTETEDADDKVAVERSETQTQTNFGPSKDASVLVSIPSPSVFQSEPRNHDLFSLPVQQDIIQSTGPPSTNSPSLAHPDTPHIQSSSQLPPHPCPNTTSPPSHPYPPPNTTSTTGTTFPPHPPSPSVHLPIPFSTQPGADAKAIQIIRIQDIPREIVQQQIEEFGDEFEMTLPTQETHSQEGRSMIFTQDSQMHVADGTVEKQNENGVDKASWNEETTRELFELNKSENELRYKPTDVEDRKTLHVNNYKRIKAEETGDPTPIPSEVKENLNQYKDMTANELIDVFLSGRISLEGLCRVVPKSAIENKSTDEEEGMGRDYHRDIETLEQQTADAMKGLSESKELISKVSNLIQTSEIRQTGSSLIQGSERHRRERMSPQKSSPVKRHAEHLPEFKHQDWKEILASYKKHGNSDILVNFLEHTSPEHITEEMISEVMACEEVSSRGDKKYRQFRHHQDSLSGTYVIERLETGGRLMKTPDQGQNQDSTSDTSIVKGITDSTGIKNSTAAKNNSTNVCEKLENSLTVVKTRESPRLPLNLTGVRSFSSVSSPSCALPSQGSRVEEKYQQRRAEIRLWMKEQRLKRRNQANTSSKSQSQLATSRNHASSKGSSVSKTSENQPQLRPENVGLSGRQLRERSQEREERKVEMRKDYMKMRENEALRLLDCHERDLATHREQMTINNHPKVPRMDSRQDSFGTGGSKCNQLVLTPTGNIVKRRQGYYEVNIKQSSTGRDITENSWKNKQVLSIPTTSSTSESSRKWALTKKVDLTNKKREHRAITDHIKGEQEISSRVKAELDSLMECLSSSSWDKTHTPVTSDRKEKRLDSVSTLGINHKNIPSEDAFSDENKAFNIHHPLNTTFTLDRIPEVVSEEASGSSLSTNTSQDTPQRSDREATELEEVSTESSWSVPSDVKKLLYG